MLQCLFLFCIELTLSLSLSLSFAQKHIKLKIHVVRLFHNYLSIDYESICNWIIAFRASKIYNLLHIFCYLSTSLSLTVYSGDDDDDDEEDDI